MCRLGSGSAEMADGMGDGNCSKVEYKRSRKVVNIEFRDFSGVIDAG